MSRIPRSQLQALRAFAAYSTDLEMSLNDLVLDVFAPALLFCQLMSSNSLISRYKCLTKYLIFLQPQAFCDALYARNSFSAGAPPRPRWGSSQHPRPPSRLGRGIRPPHSSPPRRLRRLNLGVPKFVSRKLASYLLVLVVSYLDLE